MAHTYGMTSNCALAETCARYEDDAGKHLLSRTYADFSEGQVRKPDGTLTCPFFMPRDATQQAAHRQLNCRASLAMNCASRQAYSAENGALVVATAKACLNNLCAIATLITFGGLPNAFRRAYNALQAGLQVFAVQLHR